MKASGSAKSGGMSCLHFSTRKIPPFVTVFFAWMEKVLPRTHPKTSLSQKKMIQLDPFTPQVAYLTPQITQLTIQIAHLRI